MHSIDALLEMDKRYPERAGTSEEEKLLLYSIVRHERPTKVLEVGVSAGHLTCWLALALKHNGQGTLTSVDNFSQRHGGQANSPKVPQKRVNLAGVQDVVSIHQEDSVEFMSKELDGSYDFVWIDADHSYEGAYEDIKQALRLSSKTVGVHDVSQLYPGPRDACKALEEEMNITGTTFPGSRGSWFVIRG